MAEPLVLRDYQEEAVAELLRNGGGLLADDMGLGKTLTAVELIRRSRSRRVLIVAPIATHVSWHRTLVRQFPSLADNGLLHRVGTLTKDAKTWAKMQHAEVGVFIIGWEAMRGAGISKNKLPKLDSSGTVKFDERAEGGKDFDIRSVWKSFSSFNLVIADEVHQIRTRSSLNCKVLNSISSEHKLGISATPAGGKPEGIWATLHWLWPDRYRGYWDWVFANFKTRQQRIAGRMVTEIQGERYSGVIWDGVPCAVRRKAENVLGELPPVITKRVHVGMTPKQARAYRDFEQKALAILEDEPVATPLPIVQRTALRTAALGEVTAEFHEEPTPFDPDNVRIELFFTEGARNPKLDKAVELITSIKENYGSEEPVLVLTHSAKFAELANKRFQELWESERWTGAVTSKKREKLLAEFGTPGGPTVLVASIAAIGQGTDGLQSVCRHEIWLSQPDSVMLAEQATGRLHRQGQQHTVIRTYVFSEGTIDHGVYERLDGQTAALRLFYNDDEETQA